MTLPNNKNKIVFYPKSYFYLGLLNILPIVFFFLFSNNTQAQQNIHDYGFQSAYQPEVINIQGRKLRLPFLGGLNACQFYAIDLNHDNNKDLVVFDRHGSRLLTFINDAIADSISYHYDEQYEQYFPPIADWLVLVDFNNDNKEDIFTYNGGGIKVYINTTLPDSMPTFELVTNYLLTYIGTMQTNIYVSSADLPAFTDVDGDGDLDILTFGILGAYVEWYKNLSVETDGNLNNLRYIRQETCWGLFSESENSNQVQLNITCPWKKDFYEKLSEIKDTVRPARHVGSTLLAIDMNGNGVKDLLLGDVDYFNITLLNNGGTTSNAFIVSQDNAFPSYDTAINICSFPAVFSIDVNNDGKNDLIASPFEGTYYLAQNTNCVHLYKNISTSNQQQFSFVQNDFLQGQMIDVGTAAMPVLFDYNNDGLLDLFVSNYGYWDSSYYSMGFLYSKMVSKISLYKNIGTTNSPKFQCLTNNFAKLDTMKLLNIVPTFADIDGDGDIDMLVGESKGELIYFENTSNVRDTFIFAAPQRKYKNIDVGDFSTPQWVDLNEDNLIDIVIGEKRGNLNFYQNIGTVADPDYTLITDSLGKVDVRDLSVSNFGYSAPCFFKNNLQQWNLFVGTELGLIKYYKNISGNLNGAFELFDAKLLGIKKGIRTFVTVGNLNNDNYLDMIIGNFSGGLHYFEGTEPMPFQVQHEEANSTSMQIFPNPVKDCFRLFFFNDTKKLKIISINIFDMQGNVIEKNTSLDNNAIFCPTKLSSGLYFIQVLINVNGNLQLLHAKFLKL